MTSAVRWMSIATIAAWLMACDAAAPPAAPAPSTGDGSPTEAKPAASPGSSGGIILRDVTDPRAPQECRGGGARPAAPSLEQPIVDVGGGVAVVDLDGESGPDLLSVAPGMRGVCRLTVGPDGSYRRVPAPEGAAPYRVIGFSTVDGPRGPEPIVLGLGGAVRWVRQGPATFGVAKIRIFGARGRPWASVALDLADLGIDGAAVGLGSALPKAASACEWCGISLLPPGAFALGPTLQSGKTRGGTDPLWVSHPGAAVASAFAFGPVPAAFVTDLLGADRLYAFTEEMSIADRAWHSGVATGLLDASFRSRGADLGDVDGDGRDDLAVTTWRNGVRIYGAESRGFFLDRTVRTGLFRVSAGRSWYGVLLEDLDGDGDREVIAVGDDGLLVVENRDGGLRTRVEVPALPAARGLATGDLDGDGDADLVVGLRGGGVRILLNETPPPPWRRTLRPEWEGEPGAPARGVRVRLRWSDSTIQVAERRRIRGFMSASQPRIAFSRSGAVPAGSPMLTAQPPGGPELRLSWPDGSKRPEGAVLGVAKVGPIHKP